MAGCIDVRGISSDSGGALSDSGNMRAAWKWLAVTCAVLAALVVSSLMSGGRSARMQLVEFVARDDALECQPVLRSSAAYGDLHDGEAFAHYNAVFQAVTKHQSSWRSFGESAAAESVASVPAQVRNEWQLALEEMRLGAHSRSIGLGSNVASLSYLWWSIVWCEAKLLLAEGDCAQAVRVWLDAATFAGDVSLATPGEFRFYLMRLTKCWHDDHLRQLPDEARAELIEGLVWLAARMDESSEMDRHVAAAARFVMGGAYGSLGLHLPARLGAWRSGFSLQQQAINNVAREVTALPCLMPAAARWSERMRQFDQFEHVSRGPGSDQGQWYRHRELLHRQALAHLRMLLTACRIHSGMELVPLPDPLSDGFLKIKDGAQVITLMCGLSPGWTRTVTK